jgi:peptide deformylase
MAIRKVFTEGDPVLNKHARPVTTFDDRLRELVEDMKETMVDDDGVGLAAPQVGVLRRIFVMDVDDGQGARAFINPDIVAADGEQCGPEGCLSLPGLYGIVKRPMRVTVRAQDVDGAPFEATYEGLGARCICHETDHLDGILFRQHSEIPLCAFEDLPRFTGEAETEEEDPS